MTKLHRHGLIAQHAVGIREHARADGKPPLLYSLTRRGMEVAQTREPPAISRKREWRAIEPGRALRLAHDLHALAWGIELHRLLGEVATDHWRTPRYATGRYQVPQAGAGRDRHPITLNEIPAARQAGDRRRRAQAVRRGQTRPVARAANPLASPELRPAGRARPDEQALVQPREAARLRRVPVRLEPRPPALPDAGHPAGGRVRVLRRAGRC